MGGNVVAVDENGQRMALPKVEDRPVDRATLYAVAELMFTAMEPKDSRGRPLVVAFKDVPTDLFDTVAPDGGGRRDGSDGRVIWEVRYRQIRQGESGMVRAGIHPKEVVDRWALALDEQLTILRSEQPSADWRIAAVVVRPSKSTKGTILRGQGPSLGGSVAASTVVEKYGFRWPDEGTQPVGIGQASPQVVHETTLEIGLVLYDATKGSVQDPNLKHPTLRNTEVQSQMHQYRETRRVDHMPVALYQERLEAEAAWKLVRELAVVEPANKAMPKKAKRLLDVTVKDDLVELLRTLPPARVAEMMGATVQEVVEKAGAA